MIREREHIVGVDPANQTMGVRDFGFCERRESPVLQSRKRKQSTLIVGLLIYLGLCYPAEAGGPNKYSKVTSADMSKAKTICDQVTMRQFV